ncbi:MAG: FAD-binding oxidoreductase, partial [Bryobacterales bacterium]|nr:FAD-binding oxidoreductase [Bryobacterales bacterium]
MPVELTTSALAEARTHWERLLGSEAVLADPAALRRRQTATFPTWSQVPLVLRPQGREQVQECLRIANRFHIPVYPVSSGKNWGYGSGVPAGDGVLLDLSALNRIVDFNEELAYVTVEPGVTQQQLFEFLRQRNSHLWMDATGASPSCSLIGNAMERGFGHTPYGDHFNYICGLEVVLPTGECIETGFGRYPGAKATKVYRWGVGPSLDGLFSQSNFGIVTRMTIWLMPAPECFRAFFCRIDSDEALGDVVEAIRPLRLDGTLRSAMHIANDYKVLSAIRQYPWDRMNGQTP